MTYYTNLEDKLNELHYRADDITDVCESSSVRNDAECLKHDILKLRLLNGIGLVDDLLEHCLGLCDEAIAMCDDWDRQTIEDERYGTYKQQHRTY